MNNQYLIKTKPNQYSFFFAQPCLSCETMSPECGATEKSESSIGCNDAEPPTGRNDAEEQDPRPLLDKQDDEKPQKMTKKRSQMARQDKIPG